MAMDESLLILGHLEEPYQRELYAEKVFHFSVCLCDPISIGLNDPMLLEGPKNHIDKPIRAHPISLHDWPLTSCASLGSDGLLRSVRPSALARADAGGHPRRARSCRAKQLAPPWQWSRQKYLAQ